MTDLELMIKQYARNYYDGNQQVTDWYFDRLVEELKQLNADSEILKKVSYGCFDVEDEKSKESHTGALVGSLEKIKYPETTKINRVCITPKIDGSSVVVYYKDGHFLKALTRGDGINGMNCSNKIWTILSRRNLKIPEGTIMSIRGEAYIPLKYHEELRQKGVAHPRNYGAGILNRIDAGEDIKYVEFKAYTIRYINSKDHCGQKSGCVELLKEFGFDTVNNSSLKEVPDVNILKQLYEHYMQELPVDGLVLTKEALMVTDGDIDNLAEDSIAYKFEAERATSIIESIEWGVGSTGRIVPVLKIKPINLSGATISNVTAHNYENVMNLKLAVGCVVVIERSNEVIPYLVSAEPSSLTNSIPVPRYCPKCETRLERKGVDLICPNPDCSAKVASRITGFLDVVGIPDGLGPTYLEKWYSSCCSMTDFIDMINYSGSKEIIQDAFGNHYGQLIWDLIGKIKAKFSEGFSIEEFWKMAKITGLGNSASRKMTSIDPKTLTDSDIDNLEVPINVRQALLSEVLIWKELLDIIPINKNKVTDIKMKIAITGKMSLPRKEFIRILKNNNIIEAGIGKESNYLVCNEPSGSSKYKFAKDNGIPIITEKEFLDIVGID